MSKHLTKEQWINIIKINDELSINKAAIEYLKITGKEVDLKELVRRIRNKRILLDNKVMKALQRKAGSGRPPKRDDSDIPSIIDELNEEQKNEIIEAWIKEQRNKKK
ncbi:hypothetical protein [Mesoplasma tabanidae]|uniref:Transposase n=1 Tax=Mesoplasma tabanidae TaxID=219745 RepID=A0A2K8P6M3_9MOLU|nr:hypothetical protein [Mesoplasma tabanidae]ATZ21255.1 transposase [Mesoplasma tabanidae]